MDAVYTHPCMLLKIQDTVSYYKLETSIDISSIFSITKPEVLVYPLYYAII